MGYLIFEQSDTLTADIANNAINEIINTLIKYDLNLPAAKFVLKEAFWEVEFRSYIKEDGSCIQEK